MNTTMYSPSQNRTTDQYVIKEILEATPEKLLIKVYDFAILHCQRKDFVKTNKAIQVLIDSLRFDTEEIRSVSIGLLKLYKYCQEQNRKKQFDEAYKILTELRKSWIQIFTTKDVSVK
ncbi:MAG: flagellar protein FliS [bacterium]